MSNTPKPKVTYIARDPIGLTQFERNGLVREVQAILYVQPVDPDSDDGVEEWTLDKPFDERCRAALHELMQRHQLEPRPIPSEGPTPDAEFDGG